MTTAYETTTTKAWKIFVRFWYQNVSTNSSIWGTGAVYINWTSVFSQYVDNGNLTIMEFTSETEYPAGTTVSVKYSRNTTTTTTYIKGLTITTNPVTETIKYQAVIYPKEVKAIWELWVWTIYWIYNGEFKWWVIKWVSQSVETWAITLWNAVWFLEINYNWKTVKIPYYN